MNPARKSTLVSYLDDDDDSDDGDITGYANNINHVVQDIYILPYPLVFKILKNLIDFLYIFFLVLS